MVTKNKAADRGKCKMSASMAALVESEHTRAALGGSMVLAGRKTGAAAVPSYHVFVRCKDSATDSIAGVSLSRTAGVVKTAIVPANKLRDFAAADEVVRISAPRLLSPSMNIAAPLVGAPAFSREHGASGQGVILGIVDTGLDLSHPAFAQRVLKVWDQEIQGQGPGAGFSPLGTVLEGAAMTASTDIEGHGTHVAGIAGGGDSVYDGIATGAEYLIVKTNFQNTAIVEAVRWIFEQAHQLARPCVINLSLGGHFDSHDGQDDLSVAISDECGPGRLVVASAGNEGGKPIHAHQTIIGTAPVSLDIMVQPRSSALAAPVLMVNGWYAGSGKCDIRVTSSTGAKTPWQGLIGTDPAARSYDLNNDRVQISTPDALAPNGDRQFLVDVQGKSGAVQGGAWKVELRQKSGTARDLHAWLLLDPNRPGSAAFTSAVDDRLIGSPGCGAEVVTVASYTCRNQWVDLSGAPESVGLSPDTISEFSSPGPLRDGALKPDVAAPGAMIASCLSSKSYVEQGNVIAKGYRMMAGTSMASPVVAGLLALLLEMDPQTTPAQAKEWLRKNAAIPGGASGTHDIKWGYGLVKV